MTRLARVVLAAAVAFAPSVAVVVVAPPARAAECVRVVVDYGTSSGANTHCTSASGTAAEVLAKRASELGRPAPRYRGNFLCAIDGYPESGCGDHGTEPYWSLWLWVSGRWVYSQQGVDTYTVQDSDRDGHPDPIGFRYHEFETKRSPRATPSYPKPTTAAPSRTTPPPPRTSPAGTTPGSGPTAGTGGTRATAGFSAGTGAAVSPTGAPGAPVASGPVTPGVSGTPSASGTGEPGVAAGDTGATPDAAATFAEPPISRERDGGGIPVGTIVGAFLATGLLGAAAYRFRGSA